MEMRKWSMLMYLLSKDVEETIRGCWNDRKGEDT